MLLEGKKCRLRALEPRDAEAMYGWENDPGVWHISGTLSPLSRHQIECYIEAQQYDLFRSGQQRLVIETMAGEAVGAVDLFEVEPLHRRAGVGILIHGEQNRRRGYAGEALELLAEYSRKVLGLEQLWCNIEPTNRASVRLFRRHGFRLVGTKRHWNWSPDGWKDEELWQLLF